MLCVTKSDVKQSLSMLGENAVLFVCSQLGGGGGGYFKKFLTGCAGRTMKTSPIHIKAKPEKHTYSYNLT